MEEYLIIGLIALGIAGIVLIVNAIKKAVKNKRSSCPNCKKKYSFPEDFEIIAHDLKWRKETKTKTKGDFEYEIEYRVYYRTVTFDFKCSECGHEHWFNRTYDLYNSDADYSQSEEEQIELLQFKISEEFDDETFKGKEIRIGNIHY